MASDIHAQFLIIATNRELLICFLRRRLESARGAQSSLKKRFRYSVSLSLPPSFALSLSRCAPPSNYQVR